MDSLSYCYLSFSILVIYLLFLITKKRFHLLLPSVVHTGIWIVTIGLIICQFNGWLVSHKVSFSTFRYVPELIFYLAIASIMGFTAAHIVTNYKHLKKQPGLIPTEILSSIIRKFRWIPYLCFATGLALFAYIYSRIGLGATFGDYRMLAITLDRTGYAAIAQRLSGHVGILGIFYLSILGYKFGQTKIQILPLLKYFLLCSAINIAIGGRLWLLTSSIPIIMAYAFSRHFSSNPKSEIAADNKRLAILGLIIVCSFSLLGILRLTSDFNTDSNFIDRFLYLTDGSRITNMVLSKYPESSFELEAGKCTFLSNSLDSPMLEKFDNSISKDIGLSVTVKSVMPYLYFDFGIVGSAIFWGLICFFIEWWSITLMFKRSILAKLLFVILCMFLFEAPIWNIFQVYTPRFEWLILIYLLRKPIFERIPNIKSYL